MFKKELKPVGAEKKKINPTFFPLALLPPKHLFQTYTPQTTAKNIHN